MRKLFVIATLLLFAAGAQAQSSDIPVGNAPSSSGEKTVGSSTLLDTLVGQTYYDRYGELAVISKQAGLWTYRPVSVGPNRTCQGDNFKTSLGSVEQSNQFTIAVHRGPPCGPLEATFEISNGGKTLTMLGFNRTLTRR